MKLLTHLFINEYDLAPGSEWKNESPGWTIVLLSQGACYWIAPEDVRDLKAGEIIVIGCRSEGVLRASQIAAARLHFFYFRPEHLVGLLSLSDRLSLDAFAQLNETRKIPADDPAAREFSALAQNNSHGRNFFSRCRILHLVALIFGDAMPALAPARRNVGTTLKRFEEVITRIPDDELINYPSKKMAEMCGCSLRHFRRMFRNQFKTSIRAKQTDLRLEKARQLLAETDEKIFAVAFDSGYRHLGFFNMMFKKKFGVTPSQWRRLNRAPGRVVRQKGRRAIVSNRD